jgi:hypothetical protein
LLEALGNLIDDTQHSEHHCSDASCPVAIAKRVLEEERRCGGWG